MKLFKNGENIVLTTKLPDKRETVFPRATIEDNAGSTVAMLTLDHDANGKYKKTLTPSPLPGSYDVTIEYFKDAAFTKPYRIYNDIEYSFRIEDIQETITTEADRVIDLMDDSDGRATCS